MNKTAILAFILTLVLVILAANDTKANPPKTNASAKTKFYDFDDMLIDGQVKKPQALYIDHRQKVKFERLLKLKKSFLPKLKETAKDPAFR